MKKIFLLIGIVICFTSGFANAAGLDLVLTHSVVSQQQSAAGTDVALNLTVSNQGTSALGAVTLDMADLTLWASPGTNLLTVGDIPAGGTVSLVWNISSTVPTFRAGPPLAVSVSALDSVGQPIEFSVMSVGQ